MKLSAKWLKELVPYKDSVEKIAESLTLAGLEVEKLEKAANGKDSFLEVEITTNRPDCISHIGVAREIAAVKKLPLKLPRARVKKQSLKPASWKLAIKAKEACPYYTGVLIEGVEQSATPAFIRDRLEVCGLRSVSLIVDITNYVLLETGQPLHAFDADLLHGKEIQVRYAEDKEVFKAIDGSELKLTKNDLVIADQKKPVALAGVMGGFDSQVSTKTKNVLLESAFFLPSAVRQSSRRHMISSDSSYRFERRVDPVGVDFASARALQLIAEYAKPKKIYGVMNAGTKPSATPKKVKLTEEAIEDLLGVPIPSAQIKTILSGLGLKPEKTKVGAWDVFVPSFRPDLTRDVDLIEEVARIYGYHHIPETIPAGVSLLAGASKRLGIEEGLRSHLASIGFHETITFSLISEKGLDPNIDLKKGVRIVNPQNKELCWMRPTLATSLLEVIKHNDHAGEKNVAVFEMARVYEEQGKGKQPCERKVLGLALYGAWKQKSWVDQERAGLYYDLKGIAEQIAKALKIKGLKFSPGKRSYLSDSHCELISCGKLSVGFVGEVTDSVSKDYSLDGPVIYAELDLDQLAAVESAEILFKSMARYPATHRDISMMVSEEVKAGDVKKAILSLSEPLLKKVEVFDLFRGGRVEKGFKNIAFRLTYQSGEKTLVSEDVQSIHEKIAETITNKFQAKFQ